MVITAVGMWLTRYWAVLGFQALLALLIIVMSLLLVNAENVLAAAIAFQAPERNDAFAIPTAGPRPMVAHEQVKRPAARHGREDFFAQCAQQKIAPSASTPCPMIAQSQCAQRGASVAIAHSKLSNVWFCSSIVTVKLLS